MNAILSGLSVIREREGYVVTCNRIHGDTYQVVYVNLNNGKTKVTDGTEEICKEILKDYGIMVDKGDRTEEDKKNYSMVEVNEEMDEVAELIPNRLAISIKQGNTCISRNM